jgi:hypothetical protein
MVSNDRSEKVYRLLDVREELPPWRLSNSGGPAEADGDKSVQLPCRMRGVCESVSKRSDNIPDEGRT